MAEPEGYKELELMAVKLSQKPTITQSGPCASSVPRNTLLAVSRASGHAGRPIVPASCNSSVRARALSQAADAVA
jgi:hypothetical protein